MSDDTSTRRQPLRVLALVHCDESDGCTFARVTMPLAALRATGDVAYEMIRLVPWSAIPFTRIMRDLPRWDLIYIARPRHYLVLPIMAEARRRGVPTVVDIDDWLVDRPDDHNAAGWVGTQTSRETVRRALVSATAVTVSTPVLAARCAERGIEAHIVPNAVDVARFTREQRSADTATIGFCGTLAHGEDVPLIAPALRQVLDARADVHVVSVGCPIPALDGHDRYRHIPFVSATEYPRVLSELRIDIGLAPLHDTTFTRAKSDIKYLEYSATGAATIASGVTPYKESIAPDRGVLVEPNTPNAWRTALDALLDDRDRRRRLADAAYDWVRQTRSIEAASQGWLDVFRAYTGPPAELGAIRPGASFIRILSHVGPCQLVYYGREAPGLALHRARARLRTTMPMSKRQREAVQGNG